MYASMLVFEAIQLSQQIASLGGKRRWREYRPCGQISLVPIAELAAESDITSPNETHIQNRRGYLKKKINSKRFSKYFVVIDFSEYVKQ